MKAIKYEDAIRQLEDIVEKLENNELDIDEMPEALKRAQQLLKLCRDRLTKTDAEIQRYKRKRKMHLMHNFSRSVQKTRLESCKLQLLCVILQ